MKFRILLRRTEDWDNLEWDSYVETYMSKMGYLPSDRLLNFLDQVEVWNQTYRLNYFEYRAAIKRIAQKTWEKTGIPVISEIPENEDVFIIPTDDDDWFAPNLLEVIQKHPTRRVLVWDSWVLEAAAGKFFTRRYSDLNYAASNGYCCHSSVQRKMLLTHNKVSRKKFKPINSSPAVYVKHPASFHVLQRTKINPAPMHITRELPFELDWARCYMAELKQLNVSLLRPIL